MPVDALTIRNLEKTYEGGTRALDGVSLNVKQGSFFGLLGPNGAGKTTLIGIVAGLVNRTAGVVEVFGVDTMTRVNEAKKLIGLVPQEFNFNPFEAVIDIVIQQAGYYGIPRSVAIPRAEHYLERLGLSGKRRDQARSLSGGLKRRLLIARGLVHEPQLLFLDEPTAGVDVELRRSMWEFLTQINEEGTTVVLTTHYLEEAEQLCDEIAIINRGRIVEHTTKKNLLARLHVQTFVLDLEQDLDTAPQLRNGRFELLEPRTAEITIGHGQDLNDVFQELKERDIRVRSMRNKANRLEELFLEMIECAMLINSVSLATILRKEVIRIVRIWPQTLLPSPITMSLYLLVFGRFLGEQIRSFGEVPYLDFIVPGLVLMAVITNSYTNVVTSFFSSKFHRSVEELLVSPTPNWVIILGYVMGGMARGVATGVLVMAIALFFTRIHIVNAGCAAFFLLLTSFVFALAGLANGILARKFDDVSIVPTFVIAPLTFLGGVFYSINQLPRFWQGVSLANPIMHMVNGFRYGWLGVSDVSVVFGVAVLIACAIALFWLNLYLLKKGVGLKS